MHSNATEVSMATGKEVSGKAAGGKARAESLSPARRKEIAKAAAAARQELASLPKASHGSADHPLKIGDVEIPCYVLEDGTRVISQRGFITGVGMSLGSSKSGDARHIAFLELESIKPHVNSDLLPMLRNPIRFRHPHGGGIAYGYPATALADFCEAVLAARRAGDLPTRQSQVADQCEVLVRGFARVGIIALVDEATGYQRDRERDALAKILEAFVAKELQPYVKTFPPEYYEQMFRLRGLPYPPANAKYRPQYFGVLTNDIVYERLAPGLLKELKAQAAKDEKKAKLHQRLTTEIGHPKLREHLASVTTIMKLSKDYSDFQSKLTVIHPKLGDTGQLALEDAAESE
ncbi:TPA: P63C domain-containing protein [Stenotrophomonas maltophilia]|nr:P63C domain-containing protein [Stenotrophomonas maltophilia]HDX0802531.1 P63C domain-containing protein [Stenotrophomonas maltophilia]HDX0816442.1 P63C domain-containing protein [Stenotrophomonas maltophilia]HDX0825932.1 P63C domain-containing protein [Stenotrophomonas maltophilia]